MPAAVTLENVSKRYRVYHQRHEVLKEALLRRRRGVYEEFYALRNVCPHQTQSYLGGRAHSRIEGGQAVGELEVFADDPVLACPWHGWEFRLRGGECLVDPKLRVRTYPVEVRDGRDHADDLPPSRSELGHGDPEARGDPAQRGNGGGIGSDRAAEELVREAGFGQRIPRSA